MRKAYQAFIIILILTLAPWVSASGSESIKLITQAELMLILPSDADLQNIKRQQKAFKRGLYWTKSKTLKHLNIRHSTT